MKKVAVILLAVAAVMCFSILNLTPTGFSGVKNGLPLSVTISNQDSTVTLEWNGVSIAKKYYIYGQEDPYGQYALIDSTEANVHTWTEDLIQSKKFYFVTALLWVPEGFVFVQGGTFQMGDHYQEGMLDERPVHPVNLSSFFIGKNLITQSEWQQYMTAPTYSYGTGNDYPVYSVSWFSVIKYCNLRSIAEELTPVYTINNSTDPAEWGDVPTGSNSTWDAVIFNGSADGYRLPTEAEWEYAARGGIHWEDNFRYSGCNEASDLTNYAWYVDNNSPSGVKQVGTKLPNQLGIYDMSGNLYERVWDRKLTSSDNYYQECYDQGTVVNPTGASSGGYRGFRGGYFSNGAAYCRVAVRMGNFPYNTAYAFAGFRLAKKP